VLAPVANLPDKLTDAKPAAGATSDRMAALTV
jgi:hypothetical protein